MSEPEPRRPWWWKKRCWALAALWLIVAYPIAAGPAILMVNHRLITSDLYLVLFRPAQFVLEATPLRQAYWRYLLSFAPLSPQERQEALDVYERRRNPPPPPEPDQINRTHWTPPANND